MLENIKHQEPSEIISKWFIDNNLEKQMLLFINRKDSYTRFITGINGWIWEDEFIDICKQKGFHISKSALGEKHDVIVNGFRVQCKFSANSKKIDLRNKGKNTRKYHKDDVDFFAIKTIETYYVVSSLDLLSDDEQFLLTSIKIENLKKFKEGLKYLCQNSVS